MMHRVGDMCITTNNYLRLTGAHDDISYRLNGSYHASYLARRVQNISIYSFGRRIIIS